MKTDEIIYNEQGYGFKIDKTLTKYLTEDRYTWGGVQKGLDKKYVILNVYQDGRHVNNILFDTQTQTPIKEIPLGEPGWCQLDMLKLSNQLD